MDTKSTHMPRKRDEETGQYTEAYTDDDVLDAVEALELPGTGDVAERVGCSHELAYKKLRSFEEEGAVSSRKVGNTRVWQLQPDHDWHADRARRAERAGRAGRDRDDDQETDSMNMLTDYADSSAPQEDADPVRNEAEQHVRDLDLAASTEQQFEDRLELLLTVFDTIRENTDLDADDRSERGVTASELKEIVTNHDRDHHYDSTESYWANWVRNAKLTSLPGVEYRGRGIGYVYALQSDRDA